MTGNAALGRGSSADTVRGEPDAVALYLREAGRYPLLDRDGEARLARAVQAGIRARQQLAQPATPGTDRRRQREEEIRNGRQAAAQLAAANLRLVVSVARRYQHRGLELADLIQDGNLGLLRAIDRFDPGLGYKFSTYATWWIRQAITRGLASSGACVRLPEHARGKAAVLRTAESRLEQALRRPPTIEEIAAEAKMTPREAELLRRASQPPVSLSTPLGEDNDTELADLLAASEPSPEQAVTDAAGRQELSRLLSCLSPTQANVIVLRYGLDGTEPASLADTGAALGVSRERARQLEARALTRLRRLLAQAELAS